MLRHVYIETALSINYTVVADVDSSMVSLIGIGADTIIRVF